MLTLRVALAVLKQRGGPKLAFMPGGATNPSLSGADTILLKALTPAFRWRRMRETGRFSTIEEIAAAERINDSHVSRLLHLTLMAPDIVEATLDGWQTEEMTLPGLMEPFPVDWPKQ